jgi:hypothetical protein
MEPHLITIYLTNLCPKTINTDEWPILVRSPAGDLSTDLIVRTRPNESSPHKDAVIYGQRGAGVTGIAGAGIFSGYHFIGASMDLIASAMFTVGKELGMDLKAVWAIVQQLPAEPL